MIVLISHVNADFDSVGSMIGAGVLYPGAVPVLAGPPSPNVREFLTIHREWVGVRSPQEVQQDAIRKLVVLDTAQRSRLGAARGWLDLPEVEIELFDHHPEETADIRPSVSHIDQVGSTATLVAEELRTQGLTPGPFQATALLLGLYEDTGSLLFSATRPRDLEAAAWLLTCGGDLDVVARFTRRSLRPAQRELLASLAAAAQIHTVRGHTITAAIARDGPFVEGAAELAERLQEADGAEACLLVLPTGDSTSIIGRSTTNALDLSAAFAAIGGGGHRRAASARVRGSDPVRWLHTILDQLRQQPDTAAVARDVMSAPVRSIEPDAPLGEAWNRMVRYGHSGLIVLDGESLAGIITRRDVDRARHHNLDHAAVRAFMSRDVQTVLPSTTLSEMEERMLSAGIGRLPVVEGERVLGVVTRTDLLRALHGERYLAGAPRAHEEQPDRLLRERIPVTVQRRLEEIGEIARDTGSECYLVGGFVRDLLLGARNLDIDILCRPDGLSLAKAVAERLGGECDDEARFGAGHVTLPEGLKIDFTSARTECYDRPGALPEVEPSSVADDLKRRDFSVNALAMSLDPDRFGELLDPFGGHEDLRAHRIRVLHPLSFVEDPTRILRAARFEERYHFSMTPDTEALAMHSVRESALDRITPERLRHELAHCFSEPRPLGVLFRLEALGVMRHFDPSLKLDRELLPMVPAGVEWWRRRTGGEPLHPFLVYLAGLLAPLSGEAAVAVAEIRLRMPPPDLRKLSELLSDEVRPNSLSLLTRPSEWVRRLHRLPSEATAFARARALAEDRSDVRDRLDTYVREWRHARLSITGDDLLRAGCRRGPALGAALAHTLAARLDGELTRESELEAALNHYRSVRLTAPQESNP